MKTVYVSLIGDLLHAGHMRILKKASEMGEVTVGLLTAKAIDEMNDRAFLSYSQREEALNAISCVKTIIPQDNASYCTNIKQLKPDFVIHGNDWKKGSQKKTREDVIKCLNIWGGKLIEVKYTKGISTTFIINKLNKNN